MFLALSLSLAGAGAGANGRFPAAQQVVIGPGLAGVDVMALRTTFGLVISRDAGQHFEWVCEEALFAPQEPSETPDPALIVGADGTVQYGFEWGVRRIEACNISPSPSVAERVIVDLAADPSGETVYAVEGIPGEANGVFRASTRSLVFEPLAVPAPSVLFLTVETAASDPQRLYFTGLDSATNAPRVMRSDDAGRTVRTLPALAREVDSAFLSGVGPTDANLVFLRALVGTGTALYRSTDGGERFSVALRFRGPMLGFAQDAARTVWVGGPDDGLFRSDDGGATFEPVSNFAVYCLAHHAGALYVCADWVREGWALGRSTDRGARFEPLLRLDQITGGVACGVGQAVGCDARWPGLRQFFVNRNADASVPVFVRDAGPRDAAPARDVVRVDAGPGDASVRDAGALAVAREGACGCRAGAPGRGGAFAAVWAMLGLSSRRWRRRSGRSR